MIIKQANKGRKEQTDKWTKPITKKNTYKYTKKIQ